MQDRSVASESGKPQWLHTGSNIECPVERRDQINVQANGCGIPGPSVA